MARMSFTIDGLRELDKGLAEFKWATAKAVMRRAGMKALRPMAEAARQMAPDDPTTGPPHDLKTSITVASKSSAERTGRTSAGDTVMVYMGPTRDGYPQAMMQEMGTVHHPPRPYMRPAFEQHKVEALGLAADELKTEIEKARKRAAAKALRLANGG